MFPISAEISGPTFRVYASDSIRRVSACDKLVYEAEGHDLVFRIHHWCANAVNRRGRLIKVLQTCAPARERCTEEPFIVLALFDKQCVGCEDHLRVGVQFPMPQRKGRDGQAAGSQFKWFGNRIALHGIEPSRGQNIEIMCNLDKVEFATADAVKIQQPFQYADSVTMHGDTFAAQIGD